MHDLTHLGPRIIFKIGSVAITESVIWAVIVAVILILLALWSTSNMHRIPKGKQVIAETIVTTVYKMVQQIMGQKLGRAFAPYMGTIFFFMLFSNMLGLFGIRPVTADVNTTFALSISTFLLVQITGFRHMGVRGKLRHMSSPMKFLFIINLIDDISRPISLGFRLFGNILGGLILMSLIYSGLATLSAKFSSIPILDAIIPLPANAFFDIFEPVLQAFIFTMLSMVFITLEAVTHSSDED